MALVVTAPFHLAGVLKEIGQELTAAEEKLVKDDVDLMKRVVRRAEAAVVAEVSKIETALGIKSAAPSDPSQSQQ